MDTLKRIEDLEKRIHELELKNNSNLQAFGRSYSLIGSSDSDLILKTKGLVKILWGKKFIDLIKDGKINVDAKFIYQLDTIGQKDGIYIIGESVYLKIGDSTINLIGEAGNTFVSFMEGLGTTSDAKYNAMVNIGFVYKSLDELDDTSLQNGVIYIESELKLYFVRDGVLSEFKVSVLNPFTEQFIILKNDSSRGALVIRGTGSSNSVAFDSFWIYAEFGNCTVDSTNAIVFKVGDIDKITVNSLSVIVNSDLITNMVKSPSATVDKGFRIYYINGRSVLEVDKIIERDSQNIIYPEYWLLNNRIIKEAALHNILSDTELGVSSSESILDLTLFLECTYKVGDILCIYVQKDIEEDTELTDLEGLPITNTISQDSKVELEVVSVGEDRKEILVRCNDILDEDAINSFSGKFVFLIKSSNDLLPIRLKSNSIDIVEYRDKSENIRNESIKTRVGNLTGILDGENTLEGFGIYTDHLLLGGILEKDFPKYTEALNALVSALNIDDSDSYNCVLVSVGLLKEVLRGNQEAMNELKLKVEIAEADIASIKQQLEQRITG